MCVWELGGAACVGVRPQMLTAGGAGEPGMVGALNASRLEDKGTYITTGGSRASRVPLSSSEKKSGFDAQSPDNLSDAQDTGPESRPMTTGGPPARPTKPQHWVHSGMAGRPPTH